MGFFLMTFKDLRQHNDQSKGNYLRLLYLLVVDDALILA